MKKLKPTPAPSPIAAPESLATAPAPTPAPAPVCEAEFKFVAMFVNDQLATLPQSHRIALEAQLQPCFANIARSLNIAQG